MPGIVSENRACTIYRVLFPKNRACTTYTQVCTLLEPSSLSNRPAAVDRHLPKLTLPVHGLFMIIFLI